MGGNVQHCVQALHIICKMMSSTYIHLNWKTELNERPNYSHHITKVRFYLYEMRTEWGICITYYCKMYNVKRMLNILDYMTLQSPDEVLFNKDFFLKRRFEADSRLFSAMWQQ